MRISIFAAVCCLVVALDSAAAITYLRARVVDHDVLTTSADAAALFSYDSASRELSWTIPYRNLTGTLDAVHLHGPADEGGTAPALFSLAVGASPLTGTLVLTAQQEADLFAGRWYLDFHSSGLPFAVIRGQVRAVTTNAYMVDAGTPLRGFPTALINGSVTLDLATRQMSWDIFRTTSLLDIVTGSGFAGPARDPEARPAVFSTGISSRTSGSRTLTPEQAAEVANGFWYWSFSSLQLHGSLNAYIVADEPLLTGISTRGAVGTDDDVMIAGIAIDGDVPKRVVIRARGPSLAAQGVAGALQDPVMTILPVAPGSSPVTVDDSSFALSSSIFEPTHPREAAVLMTLMPGAYTVITSGVGRTSGVGIVEVFEADHATPTSLVAISTRGRVSQGDNVLIAGFIVSGPSPTTVVVRGRGPTLTGVDTRRVLANPFLQIVRAADNVIVASNDDWADAANSADLAASGYAPANASEAAILITLDPGAYTAILSGAGGTAGIGLVEVYKKR